MTYVLVRRYAGWKRWGCETRAYVGPTFTVVVGPLGSKVDWFWSRSSAERSIARRYRRDARLKRTTTYEVVR